MIKKGTVLKFTFNERSQITPQQAAEMETSMPCPAARSMALRNYPSWRALCSRMLERLTQDNVELDALREQHMALLDALLVALPYVEGVLDNKEQLACFKKGAVQKDIRQIRAAIKK